MNTLSTDPNKNSSTSNSSKWFINTNKLTFENVMLSVACKTFYNKINIIIIIEVVMRKSSLKLRIMSWNVKYLKRNFKYSFKITYVQ